MNCVHKLYIIVIFFFFVVVGLGFVQDEFVFKLVCDELVYEFGEVDNIKKVEYDFIIWNDGNVIFNIFNVKVICGCMVVNIFIKFVVFGEFLMIFMVLNLGGKDGVMNKWIMVYFNDLVFK